MFRNLNADTDTHNPATVRTSRASLERLKRRYNLTHARTLLAEVTDYLEQERQAYVAAHPREDAELNPFRVALRALARGGQVGTIGEAFDTAMIYWMAANDNNPEIESTIGDRRAHYLRALVEIQRGNNPGILRRLANGIFPADDGICTTGCINKFAECFTGSHPDVLVVTNINERALDLFQGFLADVINTLGHPYASYARLVQDVGIITPLVRATIKAKIITCLEGRFTRTNINGLVAAPEERYINELLSREATDYMQFPEENILALLIADANAQLQMQLRDPAKAAAHLQALQQAERDAVAELRVNQEQGNLEALIRERDELRQQLAAARVVPVEARARLEQYNRNIERQRIILDEAVAFARPIIHRWFNFIRPLIGRIANFDFNRYIVAPLAAALNYSAVGLGFTLQTTQQIAEFSYRNGINAYNLAGDYIREAEQRRLANLAAQQPIEEQPPLPAVQPIAAAYVPAPLIFAAPKPIEAPVIPQVVLTPNVATVVQPAGNTKFGAPKGPTIKRYN